jgi:hypothetical protein
LKLVEIFLLDHCGNLSAAEVGDISQIIFRFSLI